jgi:hypothetical protein
MSQYNNVTVRQCSNGLIMLIWQFANTTTFTELSSIKDLPLKRELFSAFLSRQWR